MNIDVVIDISTANAVNSFEATRNDGIYGVLHKATQGITYVDPDYTVRRSSAQSAGLRWGAYHFGTGDHSGKLQAEHFLSIAAPEPGVLLALDFEPNTTPGELTMSLEQAVEFVETVHENTGTFPGLYGGASLLDSDISNPDIGNQLKKALAQCWLWYADWASEPTKVPTNWPTWTLWQYTDEGRVGGIEGPVDRNRFNGQLEALNRLWISSCPSL